MKKMKNEIIIGIGGLILAALTYFAGVYRTDQRYRKQEKEKRIENVLNRYMEFAKTGQTAGLDGLQRAGIGTLNNDTETVSRFANIFMNGVTSAITLVFCFMYLGFISKYALL